MAFQRAVRKKVFLKLAVTGPSGSGKTYSSLKLAFGLGKRVAVVDTENESASLYADLGVYDTMTIGPPFATDKYIEAINDAVKGGYDVLILDSITHAWAGEGGLLSQKEALDARGGNQFTNWASITKKHEKFKSAFLQAPIHIICTMRSKEEYAQMTGDNGKAVIKKMGTAPIQREGMSYEFSCVFDVDISHHALVTKDRTGLFTDEIFKISEATGKKFVDWLNTGADLKPVPIEEKSVAVAEKPAVTDAKPAENEAGTYTPEQMDRKTLIDEIKKIAKTCEVKSPELSDAFFPNVPINQLADEDYRYIVENRDKALEKLDERRVRIEAQSQVGDEVTA